MNLRRIALGATASALAFALNFAPAMATVFPVGSPNFFLTSGTPFTPTITAIYGNGFGASGGFDDSFTFTIPQNGVGSGSIATSFSGGSTLLTITDLIINGFHYVVPSTGSGQSLSVNGIPIHNGVLNTIRVIGTVTGSGSYGGNLTFQAVVPELGTWGMMIGGFAMVGAGLRRRQRLSSFA
jgi:hypothetical protein